ncbi:MAG: AAA family ATPase, partial [Gemmatimonadota bacterium]|nr:AAA family ATPase [Gemmatimonadota bacterium]
MEANLQLADDAQLAEDMRRAGENVRAELKKVIIGQDDVVEQTLLSLFGGGNSLIVGVPGLAKTLLIQTLADVLDLSFYRIQFTPDLMPSDITGTDIIQEDPETGGRHLMFMEGPLFANIVLADEINRTPPKTQAALLEAMQEKQVTIQGRTYDLPRPFFVLATQNPIELEGTYPLPEAQLDRFMFQIDIGYLPEDEELEVVQTTTALPGEPPAAALTADEIVAYQRLVRKVPMPEPVALYAVQLARRTRPGRDDAP